MIAKLNEAREVVLSEEFFVSLVSFETLVMVSVVQPRPCST
jgi:hypothetical protein